MHSGWELRPILLTASCLELQVNAEIVAMEYKFQHVMEKAMKDGVLFKDIEKICLAKCNTLHRTPNRTGKGMTVAILVLVLAILGYIYLERFDVEISETLANLELAFLEEACAVEHNELSGELTRPLFDCDVCQNLKAIPIEDNLSLEKFEKLYAFTGLPVVVQGGARNWTALDTYSVKYFKDIYSERKGSFKRLDEECQFMPYFTKWDTLEEALGMSDEMASLQGDHWYIGW